MIKEEQGKKFDSIKVRPELIPPLPLSLLAELYTHGAKKYSDRNWECGIAYSRVFGAILRHLIAAMSGEWYDSEFGLPHVIHAAWGCFALCQYNFTHQEMNDLPTLPEGAIDYWKMWKSRLREKR